MKKMIFYIFLSALLLSGCSDEALADRQAEQQAAYDAAYQEGHAAGYREGYQDASKNQSHIVDLDAAETDEEYLFFHRTSFSIGYNDSLSQHIHSPENKCRFG